MNDSFLGRVLNIYWERHWTKKIAWTPSDDLIRHVAERRDTMPRDYGLDHWLIRAERKPLKYDPLRGRIWN